MNDLPSVSQEYIKPKVVRFYKNGDRNFRGSHVTVTPRRFRNFDNLLNELTRITNLASGARYIFTPESGSRVESLDQLSDGKSYVCGSHPRLKKINYNHAPDGSQHIKHPNKNFVPVPPATNKLNVESRLNTTNVKPKVVKIIRNGVGINKQTVKLLLNKRTAQSYEQVMDDITLMVGAQGGFVKKIYDTQGNLVQNLSTLFGSEDVFIAVGSEKFKSSDIPKILKESGVSSEIKEPLVPSPPKSTPSKKRNKHFIQNSPYNKKKAFSSHSKLPSIKKRNEPEGASSRDTSPVENENHIIYEEKDLPKAKSDSERESSNESIKSSKHGSKTNTPLPKIESETSKDSISQPSTRSNSSASSKNEENFHVALSDVESDTSPQSKESTMVKDEKSPRKDSLIRNDTKEEKDEENNEETLKDEINDLLSSDQPGTEIEPENKIVYNERKTKVFDNKSEIEKYYDIGKKLGDGNFAVVKEVTDKENDMKFALKIIDASKMEGKLPMLQNEIKIQRDCRHPNIVRLFHDMHSPTEIFLVMELISGGDFFDLVSTNVSFEEEEASGYMRDLCSGLDYLHQRGIVHRDIKPENLMVYEHSGQMSLKIADFGLAMKVTSPIFTICGTPTYVAPEILSEEGYGLEVDVWAAGVILYIMLCGFPPFRSTKRKQTELFDLIEKCEYEFLEPYWDDISNDAKDLISKILVADKDDRLTAKKVFEHPWLTQYGLGRNNTILKLSPRRTNRFKTAARSIQSIERMKMILKLEREKFIDVHQDEHLISEDKMSRQSSIASNKSTPITSRAGTPAVSAVESESEDSDSSRESTKDSIPAKKEKEPSAVNLRQDSDLKEKLPEPEKETSSHNIREHSELKSDLPEERLPEKEKSIANLREDSDLKGKLPDVSDTESSDEDTPREKSSQNLSEDSNVKEKLTVKEHSIANLREDSSVKEKLSEKEPSIANLREDSTVKEKLSEKEPSIANLREDSSVKEKLSEKELSTVNLREDSIVKEKLSKKEYSIANLREDSGIKQHLPEKEKSVANMREDSEIKDKLTDSENSKSSLNLRENSKDEEKLPNEHERSIVNLREDSQIKDELPDGNENPDRSMVNLREDSEIKDNIPNENKESSVLNLREHSTVKESLPKNDKS
ncbi:serine/threonine-protein kinase DCLK1-like isoform X2 [Clytia hemisphaerica]